MIDQFTIDRILSTAQIVDVVSDFVTLRRRGANYTGLCPFHNEKTPSFSVSPAKGICKCFSCGKGGNAVHFIMEHEQVSYPEALKYLAKKYNIEIEERELTDEEKRLQNERESLLIINDFSSKFFQNILFDDPEGKAVGLSYFRERGFRDDIIRKFQLGYGPDKKDALSQAALTKGFNKEFLLKTGVSLERDGILRDRFSGRVMFPIHTLSGKVVGFGGRILKKADKVAKYVNSPESSIYHKSRELYGIYFAKQAIVKENRCFLVEGYTDVLSMHQAGIENVVASSGTALTQGQINLIHRFTENITVLYDGDAAGIKASIRGIDLLLEEGMNVKVVLLPNGEDPDSFAKQHSSSEFIQYIADHETDFIRFKTNLLLTESGNDPIKRASLIGDIIKSIALIPNDLIRSVYVKECSALMDVDEQILYVELNKLFRNKLEKEIVNKRNAQSIATNPSQEESPPPPPVPEEAVSTQFIQVKNSNYDPFELAIIRYIIRYGEQTCFEETNSETNETYSENVIQFVSTELNLENIEFQNPLYQKILEEATQHISDEGFIPSRYFINHPDIQISKIASELLNDRYQLSKIHTKMQKIELEEDRLKELIPRVILELKNCIVSEKIKDVKTQMKASSTNETALKELMDQLNKLNQLKQALAKTLGERIILKL